MPAPRTTKKPAEKRAAKPAAARRTLSETMRELEIAGSAQTRKTYARHGASEPMFGVSFAAMKKLVKRIGVDHRLALELWGTGNHDARLLAIKIADPALIEPSRLDRWARDYGARMCGGYVSMLAAESPHGAAQARAWLGSTDERLRAAAWILVGRLASLDAGTEDGWFADRLAQIEKSILSAPNDERGAMNQALIAIGGRSAALRKAALASAKRIGKVEVDHGDTDCKTPDAASYIEKTWAHAAAKKFSSPAAQERAREPMRTRC
jgi:3-methyladenine DNA glycosylase AlkD